jgi:hypothetical protein
MPSNETAAGQARSKARGRPTSLPALKKFAVSARKLTWDEVKDEVAHVTDLTAMITQTQLAGKSTLVMSMVIPLDHAHDAISAHLLTQNQLAFIRIYSADLALLESTKHDDDDNGSGNSSSGEEEDNDGTE